jgi:C4-dicarboxylate transporter DctQ subunit
MASNSTSEPAGQSGVLERAASWLESVLAAALLAAVVINVVNVVARYVFDRSIDGVDELQIYLLATLAFFGSVVASIRRQHLRMDVLTRWFPVGLRKALDALEAVAAAVLCGFVCWISTQYTLRMHAIGSHSENAHIPMWIPHSIVALAFAALTIVSVIQLLQRKGAPQLDERSALAAAATTEAVTP